MNDLNLTSEESLVVEKVTAELTDSAKFPMSLAQLLTRWREFVCRLEDKGYSDSIYEYANDVATRDLLETILSRVPIALRTKLQAVLAMWDTRFRAATKEIGRPITSRMKQPEKYWWFRIPVKLGRDLEKDLRDQGLFGK